MPDLSLVRPLPEGLPWPSKPTLLHGVSAADYHNDLFGDVPTFSRSIGHTGLTVDWLHAAAEHPRLPGPKVGKSSPAMSTGSLVHALLLGGEESLVIVEEKDFRKDAAIAKRDAALEAGLVPICRPQYQQVSGIVHRLQAGILDVLGEIAGEASYHGEHNPDGLTWRDLAKEVTCLWEEALVPFAPEPGEVVRCRTRLDLALIELGILADLKVVTKGYAQAEPFVRLLNSEASSYAMQAAMYCRGFEAVHPELAGRTRFIFLLLEVKPPYTVLAIEAGRGIRQLGSDRLDRALPQWARCLETGSWPGPRPVVAEVEKWAFEKEMQHREEQRLDEEGGDDEA